MKSTCLEWCRLQTLLDLEKVKHVDYLAVSVEGHELQVHRAAPSLPSLPCRIIAISAKDNNTLCFSLRPYHHVTRPRRGDFICTSS